MQFSRETTKRGKEEGVGGWELEDGSFFIGSTNHSYFCASYQSQYCI